MRYRSLLWILLPFYGCKNAAATNADSRKDSLLHILSKGIGLDDWFTDYSDTIQFNTRFTASSFRYIKSLGFTYVRIPIGETVLYNASHPSSLNHSHADAVERGISNAINAGLGVTIDFHPLGNNIDSLLANDTSEPKKIAAYWKAIAARFKKYPPGKLLFEVYNEPHAVSAKPTAQAVGWWQPVQQQLINAIRTETKEHYIIAGGEDWNSIKGLLLLRPYNDDKIIYNFHFYDPFLFTHQGAPFAGWAPAQEIKGLTYPATPKDIKLFLQQSTDSNLTGALQSYSNINKDSLRAWINTAYNWARRYHVFIICNEFGSYKPYCPKQSRLNYIQDVRCILESYHIDWAMWEYDGEFGLIDYTAGDRSRPTPDRKMLNALGLN